MPRDPANMARGMELARTALRLAPRDEYAHLIMAWAHAYAADGQLEEAMGIGFGAPVRQVLGGRGGE